MGKRKISSRRGEYLNCLAIYRYQRVGPRSLWEVNQILVNILDFPTKLLLYQALQRLS